MRCPFTALSDVELKQILLQNGHGACFVVEPSFGELGPLSSQTIAIQAYSDMWGTYRDKLTVQVSTYIRIRTYVYYFNPITG